jgi:hypothetical protein
LRDRRFGHRRIRIRRLGYGFSDISGLDLDRYQFFRELFGRRREGHHVGVGGIAGLAPCLGRPRIVGRIFIDPRREGGKGLIDRRTRLGRRNLSAAAFDGGDLGIQDVADPPVAPVSRQRQEISRMIRTALAMGASCSSKASPSSPALAAVCALSTALRIAASAAARSASAAACFCAARLSSIRATASSTRRVSALRLRLAYSPGTSGRARSP